MSPVIAPLRMLLNWITPLWCRVENIVFSYFNTFWHCRVVTTVKQLSHAQLCFKNQILHALRGKKFYAFQMSVVRLLKNSWIFKFRSTLSAAYSWLFNGYTRKLQCMQTIRYNLYGVLLEIWHISTSFVALYFMEK